MLTACGIETGSVAKNKKERICRGLQQCLPLAVLKHPRYHAHLFMCMIVATVLTACGIETTSTRNITFYHFVATVLTACGIETDNCIMVTGTDYFSCNSAYRLRY